MTPEETFEAFINGRLPKDAWTHEAHLITAYVSLRDRSPEETLDFLRDAIQTHNCGIGISNTETSGYHETLTRYYVTAVWQALSDSATNAGSAERDVTVDDVFAHRFCDRTAPLTYWSHDLLFSVGARLGWVAPDLGETPWPIFGDQNRSRT